VAAWIISHRAEIDGDGSAIAGELGRKQQKRGPQALAAARLQIPADGGDGVHGSHRFTGDLLFDFGELVLDEFENLSGCEVPPELA